MSSVLETLRSKPLALWDLDDDSPFTDYSGFSAAASSTTQPARHAALVNGAVYASIFSNANKATFTSPIFTQNNEAQPFSLKATVKPVYKSEGFVAQPYYENLATNPSFETNTAGVTSNDAGITFARSTTRIVGSGNSIKVDVAAGVLANKYWTSNNVAMAAGETMTFAFWYYLEGGTEISVRIDGTIGQTNQTLTTVGTWTRHSITFTCVTAGSYGLYLRTNATVAAARVIYIDNVSIYRGTTDYPYFDGASPGWEWTGTVNNSLSRTRASVSKVNLHVNPSATSLTGFSSNNSGTWSLAVDGTKGKIGTQSVKATVVVANASSMSNYHTLNGTFYVLIKPNTQYTVSTWMYTDTASRRGRVGCLFRTGNNNNLVQNWGNYVNLTVGDWTRVTGTFTSGPTAVFVYGNSEAGPISGNSTVGEGTWIDGFMMNEGSDIGYYDGASSGAAWAGTVNSSYTNIFASATEQQVLSNNNQYDGITINGTVVSFSTKYLTTGEARCSYDMQIPRAVNVVATHTTERNSLFVDGELVASVDITEAQRKDKFIATDSNLYAGTTTGSQQIAMNSVAVFPYALTGDVIKKLHATDRKVVDSDIVPVTFDGELIEVSQNDNDIFLDQTWDTQEDWLSAILNNVSVENDKLVPMVRNDVVTAGEWLDSYSLASSGLSSIFGVNVTWDGEGAVVEASLDGITWETCVRGKNLNIIPSGYNPTNKELEIRIRFDAGISTSSYIDNLNIVGFKTGVPPVLSGRTVTYGAPSYINKDFPALEFRDNWGSELVESTMDISVSTDATETVSTREYWVMPTSDVAILPSPMSSTTTYVNGEAAALSTMQRGVWYLVHLVRSTPISTNMNITGSMRIGQAAIYDYAMTAPQVADVYKAYTGQNILTVSDSDDITITQSATAAGIYAHDWANSAS